MLFVWSSIHKNQKKGGRRVQDTTKQNNIA
jgi:hypothetical protein